MEHPQKESFSKRQQSLWIMLKDFVRKCFDHNPSERPSTRGLLNDPFITSVIELHNDDDENAHYGGLFSPNIESKTSVSQPLLAQAKKKKSPEHALTRTKNFVHSERTPRSPSCPMSGENRISNSGETEVSRQQRLTRISPTRDTREWPAWAKNHTEKSNVIEQDHPLANKTISKNSISELMDSLALSEDSTHCDQTLLTGRVSSTTGGSTVRSNLAGLIFLESSRTANLTK